MNRKGLKNSMKAILVLEDGKYFQGESFGCEDETAGEVVFNTCMTGYQEISTDPSYSGQIVTMTYPLIGNYGFNTQDNESYKTHVQGFIVKELCNNPNNWRNSKHPEQYFRDNKICGIKGIDTRELTQHIRQYGSMFGIISTRMGNPDALAASIKGRKLDTPGLVAGATTKQVVHRPGTGRKVVLLDYGVKYNIIRALEKRGCDIHVLPANSTADTILSYEPDGILLSNGPGDPRELPEITGTIRQLVGRKPVFGICLGHQLLGLSLGLEIFKLKFGHHGGNHPVRDLNTGKCYITSQNHNYAVSPDMSPELEREIRITHQNVNDGTVEGFTHNDAPVLSIQYHPEAAPGPEDSAYIFDQFIDMMKAC